MSTLVRHYGEIQHWPPTLAEVLPSDRWQVLLARPRQEKLLQHDLQRLRVPNLLFIEHRVRSYTKGVQRFDVPMFGGYVFAVIGREQRNHAFETGRVARMIDVCDPPALTRQLSSLITLLRCHRDEYGDVPLVIRPDLVAGCQVQITSGTFASCCGVVVRRHDDLTLVVNLPILGHSVAVTIPVQTAQLLSA